jgi:hypothetical protein
MRNAIWVLMFLFLSGCVNDNNSTEQSDTSDNQTEIENQSEAVEESEGNSKKSSKSKASQFIWDFSTPKTFVYSFEQSAKGENKSFRDKPAEKMSMSGIGKLLVKVKENNLADLSLAEIKMTMQIFNEDGSPGNVKSAVIPTKTVENMQPNGSLGASNYDVLFDILMPLPSKDLKKGQEYKVPIKMPFSPHGSAMYYASGFNTLKFVGFETIDNKKCAVLKGDIDVSKIENFTDLVGENKSSTTGKATYYFDINNHYYVGADIDLTMEVLVDGQNVVQQNAETYLYMKNINTYKIRLEKIM